PRGPAEAACALCQRAPREPVRADCGHRFCRACVVRFWAEEDGPFPCPECADDCWQRAVEPGRPPLSRRLLALEEAARRRRGDGPASEAALQLLCRADPPEWEPRWRKALRGKENKGSVEIMRKDLNDARDLHGQAESAAAVWKGHVMDRRKKALTDYKKLRAFFVEEEEYFLQEAEKEEGEGPGRRFQSLATVWPGRESLSAHQQPPDPETSSLSFSASLPTAVRCCARRPVLCCPVHLRCSPSQALMTESPRNTKLHITRN
uniref:RING-type domain-containing protein n=1 Tax=Aotus nancymaae TaxID=37293 RepID=A0A2K5D645_AOTNA